jgi:hypothetical protein
LSFSAASARFIADIRLNEIVAAEKDLELLNGLFAMNIMAMMINISRRTIVIIKSPP